MYVANSLQEVEGGAVSIMLDFMLLHNQSIVLLLLLHCCYFYKAHLYMNLKLPLICHVNTNSIKAGLQNF